MNASVLDDLFEINRQLNRIFDLSDPVYRGRWPETNLYEDKDAYLVAVKVPGLEKKEIEISLKDKTITIRGERKKSAAPKGKVLLEERFAGSFERSFMLSDKIDEEHIRAESQNGLLLIRLPKSPEAKPRTIEIN